MAKQKFKLTEDRPFYKPFSYPWCYDAFTQSEQMHWLAQEVPMMDDVGDWSKKLTENERKFLTHIFRFFTQGDIDVSGAYVKNYLPVFPQPEVRMMLSSFAAREATHVAAYSHLIETLGMPETTYNEFLQYEEMKEKHDYINNFISEDSRSVAEQIAVFSAFTEGMQLFSSFIMLLNFPRHGKMKGMGQVISWSVADEAVAAGTEVLVDGKGWMRIEDLSISDSVYQYDMATKESSFQQLQKIQHVIRDKSYVFSSSDVHQHVSPNHRMIVMDGDGNVAEVLAKDAPDQTTLILNGDYNTSGDDEFTDEDKLAIDQIVLGSLDVDWLYDRMKFVSSKWAREAVDYYLISIMDN